MKLLVSFVNQVFTPELKLGVFDTDSERFSWVLQDGLLDGDGATGIAQAGEKLYICIQQKGLLVFSDGVVSQRYDFKFVRDPHSIYAYDGDLLVVSTWTNQLYRLGIDEAGQVISEKLFWSAPDVEDDDYDFVHLNSVFANKQGVFVSLFGRRERDESWSGIREGQILKLPDQIVCSGVKQPHSVAAIGKDIVYCESLQGTVNDLAGKVRLKVEGYVRGISVKGSRVFVGVSGRRQLSKSTNRLLRGRTGEFEDPPGSKIVELDRKSGKVVHEYDLSHFGNEIFELKPLSAVMADALCSQSDPIEMRIGAFEKNIVSRLQTFDDELRSASELAEAKVLELQSLTELVRGKDKMIEKLQDWSGRLERQVSNREKELAKVTKWAASLEDQVKKRDEAVAKLQDWAAALEEQVNKRDEAVARWQDWTATLEEQVNKRDEAVARSQDWAATLEGQVKKRDEAVARLRDWANELEGCVRNRDESLGKLRPWVERLETQVKNRDEDLLELKAWIQQLEAQAKDSDSEMSKHVEMMGELQYLMAELTRARSPLTKFKLFRMIRAKLVGVKV